MQRRTDRGRVEHPEVALRIHHGAVGAGVVRVAYRVVHAPQSTVVAVIVRDSLVVFELKHTCTVRGRKPVAGIVRIDGQADNINSGSSHARSYISFIDATPIVSIIDIDASVAQELFGPASADSRVDLVVGGIHAVPEIAIRTVGMEIVIAAGA